VGRLTRRVPFEGVRIRAVSEIPSPENQRPLMGLDALWSLMNIEVTGVSGYLLPPRARCFQRPGGLPSTPSPVPLQDRVHPPVGCASPSEYVAACHLPDTECRAPSLGSVSPSRHERMESTRRRASRARLRSAHSVSHALDGFLLHAPRGLVSSHCRVRDSHFRGFPRCQAGSPHRRVVPS
jgi:hypothetical protein